MRGSRLRAACLGLGLAALSGCWVFWGGMDRAPERADRELRPDQPIAAAMFRYRQRLSEDGTIPENALLRAKAQRDRMPVFEWLEGEPEGGEAGIQGVSPGSWTWLGPGNIGGRIRGVLIHPSNPSIIYVGACSGGIWKTVNGGSAWFPLDDFMPTLAVNCLAMDPANPEILYAGTGEGFFETVEGTSNTAAVRGAGIFKSVDAGETWFQLPSTTGTDWYFVNRIAICPTNPSLMLVATTKGIFRSTNGGASFTKTNTRFAYDVRFHPTNPNLAIAGFHDDGAMRTLDGGATWVASTGLTGHRTELAYYDGNPSIIYAGVSQSGQIKLYRSLDGGATFALRTSGSGISTYEAYNSTLWVDPTNSDRIIFGGVYLYRSIDGGVTHTRVFNSVHADMHNIVHHPAYNGSTNRTVYFATDGGLYRTTDSLGTSATGLNNNLGITQFYGAVMNPISGRVMGGTQDNGTKLFTGSTNWATTFGGDGGFCATDPTDANYFYGEVQWARIFRSTNGGTSASYIHGGPNPITGVGTSQFNFIPYFMLDPNEPNRMYVCGRYLWRSNNVKATQPDWSRIKSTIEPGGTGGVGPPPGDGGGAHFRHGCRPGQPRPHLLGIQQRRDLEERERHCRPAHLDAGGRWRRARARAMGLEDRHPSDGSLPRLRELHGLAVEQRLAVRQRRLDLDRDHRRFARQAPQRAHQRVRGAPDPAGMALRGRRPGALLLGRRRADLDRFEPGSRHRADRGAALDGAHFALGRHARPRYLPGRLESAGHAVCARFLCRDRGHPPFGTALGTLRQRRPARARAGFPILHERPDRDVGHFAHRQPLQT
jgi:hypothetical protein